MTPGISGDPAPTADSGLAELERARALAESLGAALGAGGAPEGLLRGLVALAAALGLPHSRLELTGSSEPLERAARALGLTPARTLTERGAAPRLAAWVEAHGRVACLGWLEEAPGGARLALPHLASPARLRELFRAGPAEDAAWPFRLAREQVRVLPARAEHQGAAEAVVGLLAADGLRVGGPDPREAASPLRCRVAAATAERVPCLVVVGDEAPGQVALRMRGAELSTRGADAVERLTCDALRARLQGWDRDTIREGSPGDAAGVPEREAAKVAAARGSAVRVPGAPPVGEPGKEL